MRPLGTAFALLSLGLILGCAQTPATTAVQAAPKPPAPQHSVNRYELHGSPDKVALLVDSETGTVWQYKGDDFKRIPVQGMNPCVPVSYADNGKIYDIPCEKEHAFLEAHPKATPSP